MCPEQLNVVPGTEDFKTDFKGVMKVRFASQVHWKTKQGIIGNQT